MDFHAAQELATLSLRDGVPGTRTICDLPPYSRIPARLNASIDHLAGWVNDRVAPPTAPEIEVLQGTAAGVARDAHGNALGGIRLPQHAVPTATNTGVNSGLRFCRIFGSHQPFDADTLKALYPNQGMYVSRVAQATTDCLSQGFIGMEDGIETIREAAESDIGRQRP